VDEDGFPQASLVSEAEVDRLIQYAEDFRRLESLENEDMEDVFDESLLPLKEETFVNSQRSDPRSVNAEPSDVYQTRTSTYLC
ncbi:hypothetical protein LINGRAHAP2_LOCUS20143, partial [Linum grandiflorum]